MKKKARESINQEEEAKEVERGTCSSEREEMGAFPAIDSSSASFVSLSGTLLSALEGIPDQQHALLDRRYGLSTGASEPDAIIASDLELPLDGLTDIEDEALRSLIQPVKKDTKS